MNKIQSYLIITLCTSSAQIIIAGLAPSVMLSFILFMNATVFVYQILMAGNLNEN